MRFNHGKDHNRISGIYLMFVECHFIAFGGVVHVKIRNLRSPVVLNGGLLVNTYCQILIGNDIS